MIRKAIVVLGACILALLGVVTSKVVSNPLRRSDASIQHWLEKTTPLGSTLLDVRGTATKRGWYDPNMQGSDGQIKGTYLRGEPGEYQGLPFCTSVTVFWEFDSSDRLVNIRIWKTQDAL
jgi:hypothetical protein